MALIRRNKRSSNSTRQRKDMRNDCLSENSLLLKLQQKNEPRETHIPTLPFGEEKIMFPLLGFEVSDDANFFKTPEIFAYKGSLKDAYSQL